MAVPLRGFKKKWEPAGKDEAKLIQFQNKVTFQREECLEHMFDGRHTVHTSEPQSNKEL